MVLSQRSHEGYLMVDHRSSPGLTEAQALKLGYLPEQVKEGKVYEAPTMGCTHCGSHVILNPQRTRHRGFCMKCNHYICDFCDAARTQTGYTHITIYDRLDQALQRSNTIG